MVATPLTKEIKQQKQAKNIIHSSRKREPLSKHLTVIQVSDIVVPSWYPKIFVNKGEVQNAVRQIQDNIFGCEDIIVRYVPNLKQYELIKGLVTLKGHLQLKTKEVEVEVVDDDSISKADSVLAAISYNSSSGLNHYESTIAVLKYLEFEFQVTRKSYWTPNHITKTKTKHIVEIEDITMGKMECLLNLRNESQKDSPCKDRLIEIRKQVTETEESVIDSILGVINVDLYTFVKKRLPLLKLQPEIVDALKSGELAYSKAISLSRLGKTKELMYIIDSCGDIAVNEALILERRRLLQKTLRERLTTSQLGKLINQANIRLLAIGTDTEAVGLSDRELGDREANRQDITMNGNIRNHLVNIKKYFRDWEFLAQLEDREKSAIYKKIESLHETLEKANKSLALAAAEKAKEAKEQSELAAKNSVKNQRLEKAKLGIL